MPYLEAICDTESVCIGSSEGNSQTENPDYTKKNSKNIS